MKIRRLRKIEFKELFGAWPDIPTISYAIMDGDEIFAVSGLQWGYGRCWMTLSQLNKECGLAQTRFLRHAANDLKKRAAQLGENVLFSYRDDSLPNSEKFLRFVGMEKVGVEKVEMVDGTETEMELWRWQTPYR